jgi:hypothetical protein
MCVQWLADPMTMERALNRRLCLTEWGFRAIFTYFEGMAIAQK